MPDRRSSDIDSVIHQEARLRIVSSLVAADSMTFNELKALLGLTDGNLSTHATVLEKAGYITIVKGFEGRKPKTTLKVRAAGRRAFARYVDELERLLHPK
jgi:DNA-binding MarR family transcriptional regulator